ncbi:MAG: FAD-dependent oxidoreductase [Cyanobacteria bacterium J06626_14]
MFDVAIIGAGFAGLTCARALRAQGLSVTVLEKSRGLGGRVATRRVEHHCFSYGARYIKVTGPATQKLLDELNHTDIADRPRLIPWPQTRRVVQADGRHDAESVTDCYIPLTGMTAIAKYLARDIPIKRQYRVNALSINADQTWTIYVESRDEPIAVARSVVLAIPAPQAEALLHPLLDKGLPPELLSAVQSVEFDPCFTIVMGYSPEHSITQVLQSDELCLPSHSDLQWIGMMRSPSSAAHDVRDGHIETTVEQSEQSTIIVAQSSPTFAAQYLEITDRQAVGHQLLTRLGHQLNVPDIHDYDWTHMHLWRYAICRQPVRQEFLLAQAPGLIGCIGDWCGGHQLEHAITSGLALSRTLPQHR